MKVPVQEVNKIRISGEIAYADGVKKSKAGNDYARAALIHTYPNSERKAWWTIVSFGEAAKLVGDLKNGDRVVLEGQAEPGRKQDGENGPWIDTRPTVTVSTVLEVDSAAPSSDLPPDTTPAGTVKDDEIPF